MYEKNECVLYGTGGTSEEFSAFSREELRIDCRVFSYIDVVVESASSQHSGGGAAIVGLQLQQLSPRTDTAGVSFFFVTFNSPDESITVRYSKVK